MRQQAPLRERIAAFVLEAKHLAFFLVCMAALAAVVFFHLSVRNNVIQLGYSLSQENSRGRALVRQRSELELERALMKNPEEIGKAAGEKFGMHIPDKEQLVRVGRVKGSP